MTHIYSLGAINKFTGEYVYPKIANKIDEYICPECNKDLILCQGKIRTHHFRHKIDNINPCNYYNKPNESQIHKDAKLLLKNLLERKIPISFIRKCNCCEKNEEFEIPEINEKSLIDLEYRFEYNGIKIADVAYIDDGDIICIFEIYNTHKTSSENRPEPWFEINAEVLINTVNSYQNTIIKIPCVRNELCDKCIEKYTCKGYGECLIQHNNYENEYIKDKDLKCYHYCKPIKCPTKYCNYMAPQWYFNCSSGMCVSCAMGIEPLRYIYLDVPYSKKNEVKTLGAKFNFNGPYKKWFIKSDNKNKDIILSKFKEWICPY
jgi:hypothetical protein